jgi:Zn-dependent peptidase ImmA (M78 family)
MVKMIPDPTRRFARRPYYTEGELDRECEQITTSFLRRRHGKVRYPFTTEDLGMLIEQEGADLDSSVDLSRYGQDVEGVTAFRDRRPPEVMISDQLAGDPRRENRLRTTLTHEFGHVRFHGFLWAEKFATGDLFAAPAKSGEAICKRDTILNARQSDWMEWQAGYISGAILMPAGAVRRLVDDYCAPRGVHGVVPLSTGHALALIQAVQAEHQVSEEAARVRLLALKVLTDGPETSPLFSR